MSVKFDEKGNAEKTYIIKRCLPCGEKLHVNAYKCNKCRRRADSMTYGSRDPDDAIFNWLLNRVDGCVFCLNAKQGNPCVYIICYGSGKGDCGICKRFNSTRYECCQRIQAREKKGD